MRTFLFSVQDEGRKRRLAMTDKNRTSRIQNLLFVMGSALLWLTLSAAAMAQNPVPLIDQPLVPGTVQPGGAGFTLTVNGTGFVSGATVHWNGSPLATTFVSASHLTASVTALDVAKAGTASVTVVTPAPGGGDSNTVFFPIALPTGVLMARSDYSVGSHPNSVSTADLREDGKLDIVLANGSDQTVSVLLGNGDGTFQPQVTYAVGNSPGYVAIADFNGDGKLDLAVTNVGSNSVSILLGNGDGTFQPEVQYDAGTGAWGVAVADVNADGKLDLVVTDASAAAATTTISVLLGNGDGTFQPHVEYQAGLVPTSVAIGDFNGDGKLDLAVADFSKVNTVTVLLGKGDGTFSAPVSYPVGFLPEFVAAADLNRDGKLDLVVANQADSTVSILLGNGDGTFRSQVTYATGCVPTSVVVADFNGDGNLDIAVPDYCDGGGSAVSILLGNGDGTFQPHLDYTVGQGPNQVAFGDFDQDGRLDVAAADQSSNQVSILLQDGAVSLSPPSLSFGGHLLGTTSAARTVTLTNVGATTLTISGIAIAGTNAADFAESNTCGSSLAANAHCTISVTFTPDQLGQRTAAITITDNGPGSPQSVPLSGIGVTSGPNVTLSSDSVKFGTHLVGTTSAAKTVTLSNYGAQTLNISGIAVSGAFTETNTCGTSLASVASCSISVSFAPTSAGNLKGTLSLTDNAPASPQSVKLTGAGTVVELNPGSLSFGTHTVETHTTWSTTLTNTGSTTLTISGITIAGTDAGDFTEADNCVGNVATGAPCTISVTFTPKATGTRTANVSISDDGGGSPQHVSLSGIGTSGCCTKCYPHIGCHKYCPCRLPTADSSSDKCSANSDQWLSEKPWGTRARQDK
jgi:hypothetical protein